MSVNLDYIKFDAESQAAQERCKTACHVLAAAIAAIGPGAEREKALARTKLEEVYARCGRAVRDAQIARNGTAELQEGRSNE